MQEKFSYAVVGSGAIGSYYGGKLAANGQQVRFLMRSDLDTVRTRGLELIAPDGTPTRIQVQAFGTPAEIGPVDVVLIGIKATANTALEELLPPLLKESTLLVTLQNGLGNEEFLADRFGAHRVLGGLCFICLNRIAPGVVVHYGAGSLSLGEFKRPPTERIRKIAADFLQSGVEARVVESLVAERWRKLVWNIPFNGLSIAAGNLPTGQILAQPHLRQLTRDLMEEVAAVANRLGHPIPTEFIERQFEITHPMGDYKPSSLIDHLAGRPVEVEAIWGEAHRQARKAGMEMPRVEMLYQLLKSLTILR